MQEKAAGDWTTNHTTIALAPNPTTNTPTGFSTWQNFVNDFRNMFITTDNSADARCQLLNIKQTGTTDDYNTQFRSLALNTTGTTTTTSSAPHSTRFRNLFSTTTPPSPTPTNRPKKLTPKEREKCMKEGCCLACREVGHNARDCTKYKACTPTAATTIRQVAPDPAPATPTLAAAEPAKPTSKAEIIAHI
ncbi:hypothetical protein EW145_g5741 [Phellinidium pouzarii]|uniref:CCHC-type domain-containing protein n=1 Tax=Phellinidium pouzarii TaxID=167371 RepID=A0A4S4KYY6_9AGAM|nr:hypothetical protein EW145_g5741 [Phellinidium pouzarii]